MDEIEYIARAICEDAGDDPDALAYPPMMHNVSSKKAHMQYVPTAEYEQPKPAWNWYKREASVAFYAMKRIAAAPKDTPRLRWEDLDAETRDLLRQYRDRKSARTPIQPAGSQGK